jgi:hypothetical protein
MLTLLKTANGQWPIAESSKQSNFVLPSAIGYQPKELS